jgi:hypothetical protein
MDINEPAGWVRQFSDRIADEPNPVRRAQLLDTFSHAARYEVMRLRRATAYDLRAGGLDVADVAIALHATRQTVTRWAKEHARANRLPPVWFRKGERPLDLVP